MRQNTSFSVGSLLLINKAESTYHFFERLFDNIKGRSKNLKESAKLFSYNKMEKSVSISRILDFYPPEVFEQLNFNNLPTERTLYRNLERIGDKSKLVLANYQRLLKEHQLASDTQFADFSSTYFEGTHASLGALGYSRDHEPGKKQLTFGIATGMNGVPSALTIQRGNVQDKKHMALMIKTVSKVLEENSAVIFDCGGNTRSNKERIRKVKLHYLTLKAKKRKSYLGFISVFKEQEKTVFSIGERTYECVKVHDDDEVKYVFFSPTLRKEQRAKREKKLAKELEKNDGILSKVKKGKAIARFLSREGDIIAKGEIQKRIGEIANPFITGLEGYFILESSLNDAPEKILALYKQKDKAEKLIRDIKEGTDLRPIRHWSKRAIIGYILIVFLTNCLYQLTLFLSKLTVVKNLKLLKKYLSNLTVTYIYPHNALRYSVLSNISEGLKQIFGNILSKFSEKPPDRGK